MPRRRRTSKLREDPVEMCQMFLMGDGVHPMLSLEPVYENRFLAAAAWETYRARTWELREAYAHPWPPTAAGTYDAVTHEALSLHGHELKGTVLAKAATADLKGVAAFRRNKPAAAAEIAPFLDAWEATVATALALGKQAGRQFVDRNAFEGLLMRGRGGPHVDDAEFAEVVDGDE